MRPLVISRWPIFLGNGNNGTLLIPAGTAELGAEGLSGGTALKTSGGGELVVEGIEALDNFSVSLWMQLDALSANVGTVFARGNIGTPAFALLAIDSSLAWLPESAGGESRVRSRERFSRRASASHCARL